MKNRRNRKRGRAVCGARCALTLTAVFLLGLLPGFLMMEQAAQAEEPAAAAAAVFGEVEIRGETGGASEPAGKPAPAPPEVFLGSSTTPLASKKLAERS